MADSSSAGPPRASLSGIPPELRMRIFRFVFEGSEIRIHLRVLDVYGHKYTDNMAAQCECSNLEDCAHQPHSYEHKIDTRRFEIALPKASTFLRNESLELLHTLTKLRLCSEEYGPSMDVRHGTPIPLPPMLLQRIRAICVDYDLARLLPFDQFSGLEVLTATRVDIYYDSAKTFIDDKTPGAVLVDVLEDYINAGSEKYKQRPRALNTLVPSVRLLYSVTFCDDDSGEESAVSASESRPEISLLTKLIRTQP